MHVKLKVLRGASVGKEVAISGPRFFIGRSEECHLRVKSDAISRRHCAITVVDGAVRIRDLGSRNGTFVNGHRIDGEHPVQMGDQLRVGPLEFLVTYLKSVKETAKPKSSDSSVASDEDMAGLIDGWLSEADTHGSGAVTSAGETREFRLDETSRIDVSAKSSGESVEAKSAPNGSSEPAPNGKAKTKGRVKAKKDDAEEKSKERSPVLPTGRGSSAKEAPKDTQEAAAQTLRKFFNRGG